ncbi:MAG: glycoside hydrolase family 43 protein [Chitinophagaceae bacterium]
MKWLSYKTNGVTGFIIAIILTACFKKGTITGTVPQQQVRNADIIQLADPTIFYNKGTYYLYGTGGDVGKGFLVYSSPDMKSWKGPVGATGGYALVKGDTYGTGGFWAPQVFYYNNKFYIAYTANEHIAIAQSDTPTGPFKQSQMKSISGEGKQIDPYVFIDSNGKKYLYHVRLTAGNRIFVAELQDDLSDIKPETVTPCITATEHWENTANTAWPVTEGPTVLRHKGLYYLFYSANDFRNIDYAVGYAISEHPSGPWKKFSGNPVISRKNIGVNGTGHGDFIQDREGNLSYVFHTHASDSAVQPRLTAIVKGSFVVDSSGIDRMMIDAKSFRYLTVQGSLKK